VWEYSKQQSSYHSTASAGTVEFKSDGTAVLRSVPVRPLLHEDSDAIMDVEGEWEIPATDPGPALPSITIFTRDSKMPSIELLVLGSGNSMQLISYIGDPDEDNKYVLRKR
jgi:hypothetical protein